MYGVGHFFEGLAEPGVEWLFTQARLLQAYLPAAKRTALSFELVEQFDFSSREYAELFARAEVTAFQHPLWLERKFARLVGSGQHAPAVLVGRSQPDRRLMFVLPMIRRKLGPFVLFDAADLEVGDYNALVVDRRAAADPGVARQITRTLRRLNLVRIRKVREQAIGFSAGDAAKISAMDYNAHEIELTLPLDGWQERLLKPEFARYLRSKRKRLAAKGPITLEAASSPAQIRTAFQCMRDFRRHRWADDILADQNHFEFYLDVAVAGHDSGFARTYVLSVGGKAAAVLFGVCHKGRFCFLLLGFDNRNFRNHSTGLLGLESAIEDSIRRGDAVFDLTIGDEAYKQDFATRSVPMSVVWFGRKPLTRLAPKTMALAKRTRARFAPPKPDRITGGTAEAQR